MTQPTSAQQFQFVANPEDAPFPPAMQHRIDLIAQLGKRRDAILNAPVFDVEAARELVRDYELNFMPTCAASMRLRINHYERPQCKVCGTREHHTDEHGFVVPNPKRNEAE